MALDLIWDVIGSQYFPQRRQHDYRVRELDIQLRNQLFEQEAINRLRKDFFEFQTKLQRESEAIRQGGQIDLSIAIDLARRAADNSPFIDSIEDARKQLFEIYVEERKPLMLVAPFWDESVPHTAADAGGLAQMRTAITRAWGGG